MHEEKQEEEIKKDENKPNTNIEKEINPEENKEVKEDNSKKGENKINEPIQIIEGPTNVITPEIIKEEKQKEEENTIICESVNKIV